MQSSLPHKLMQDKDIPSGAGGPAGGVLGRWFPFVFPWSTLVGMTGAVIADGKITLTRGRLAGGKFHIEAATHLDLEDADQSKLQNACGGSEPVCVCLARSSTLVRHFHLPTESADEINSMLAHLLENELPTSIDHYSWVWDALPSGDEGFSQVAVYIARNDQMEEYLAPLISAGCNVVGLVPEGWAWAYAVGQVREAEGVDDEGEPRCILIKRKTSCYLVVEQSGRLLFDMVLPLNVLQDGSLLAEARDKFESLFDLPLPNFVVWPDAEAPENAFFAAAVGASALERDKLMISSKLHSRAGRRNWLVTLAGLGKLILLTGLVWLALTLVQDHRTRQHLAALEKQLEEESPRVQVLEKEFNAIRESTRARAGNTEILLVISSLRSEIKKPIFVEHFSYVQGRGVTLRGAAPTSSHVLEMTEKLTADPLWEGLRVMQLRTERVNTTEQVHFVVEGQLR